MTLGGTKLLRVRGKYPYFVPSRIKLAHFGFELCTATGHLFRVPSLMQLMLCW